MHDSQVQANLPILIDQDGVIADFVAGLYVALKQFATPEDFKLLPDPLALKTFYVDECVSTGNPVTDERLRKLICNAVDTYARLFRDLPPIAGALHYLRLLAERAAAEQIDVVICTSPHVIHKTCHSDKTEWLETHLGRNWAKHTVMTHDKTLVQGLVLVDDKPVITGRTKPCWQHVIFDASYNRSYPGLRAYGWSEQTVDLIMDTALKQQLLLGFR